jgi:hypothetical protein
MSNLSDPPTYLIIEQTPSSLCVYFYVYKSFKN